MKTISNTLSDTEIEIIDGKAFIRFAIEEEWCPTQLIINDKVIYCDFEKGYSKWKGYVWDDGDDLSSIYGGIDDNSTIEILIIIYQ
jgi:hypothetical protein